MKSSASCPPRAHVRLEAETDLADAVISLAGRAGVRLADAPWKREVLEEWSAIGSDGKFVHKRCGLSGPRQMGKSWDGIGWAMTLSTLGYKVLWSDHNYSTTCEMLRRFKDIFGSRANDRNAKHPEFNRLVSHVNNNTGQEAIELSNGGKIGFSTRTKTTNLGFEYDVLFLDEAQELLDEHMQAMLPTTSGGSKRNSQVIYLGTPERAGGHGEKFGEFRDDALCGMAGDCCWREYGIDRELTREQLADRELVERILPTANPSVGYTADMDAIFTGLGGMSPLAASQEYFGYWLPNQANAVLDGNRWRACEIADKDVPEPDRLAYAVKFAADGTYVALSIASRAGDGPVHLELWDYQPLALGTTWLVKWLADRWRGASAIVVDGRSGADALVNRLVGEAGIPARFLTVPSARDVVSADAMLLNAVDEGEITHISDRLTDESAATSTRRAIGRNGGWGFDGDTSAIMESFGLALWGLKTSKRDPRRVQEVNF